MSKMPNPKKVEYQENQRYDAVVNAVSQKWICSCGKEFKIAAEQNECGNMPAHDKHAHGNTHNRKTYGRDISKIFRSEVQRIRAEAFHEHAIHSTKENKPEYKQHLVSPEVQENQLYGKRIIETP